MSGANSCIHTAAQHTDHLVLYTYNWFKQRKNLYDTIVDVERLLAESMQVVSL